MCTYILTNTQVAMQKYITIENNDDVRSVNCFKIQRTQRTLYRYLSHIIITNVITTVGFGPFCRRPPNALSSLCAGGSSGSECH